MSQTVSIRPGVAMLGLFPHMKYKPWYALGELVDNAIQSYLSNRDRLRDEHPGYRLRVEIEVNREDGGSIVVRDNAAGIAASDWDRAFQVAEPPADASGLSQFGIGMKAAACWFAREWSLRSTHMGETVVREVLFDVPTIVATRDETLDVVEEATDWSSHFTEIRMWNLHRLPQTRTVGRMRTYLGSIYRQFLRNGDVEILFNGEPVEYEEPAILTAPRWSLTDGPEVHWRKDVNVLLPSGRRVTGFVALREKGSTAESGLALFYRRKVVTGAGDETYRPEEIFGRSNSFRSQRVFGELNMDDFSVTYTKDAIVWYDEEEEFLDLLRKALDDEPMPILKQAENYRVRVTPPAVEEEVRDVVEGVGGLIAGREIDPEDVDVPVIPGVVVVPPASGPGAEPIPAFEPVEQEYEIFVTGERWLVTLSLVADEAIQPWVTAERVVGSPPRVKIRVNQAHPFMRAFCELPNQELEPVWRIAVALGLGQEVARAGGVSDAGIVTQKVNKMLRSLLSARI